MTDALTLSIRDLVPHPDLFERPVERELRLHHVAQAQLRRKYKSFHSEVTLSAQVESGGETIGIHGRLDGFRRTPRGIVLYEIKSVPGDSRRWVNSPLLQNARWQLQLYVELARLAEIKPWGKGKVVECVLCLISESHKQALEPLTVPDSSRLLQDRLRVVLSSRHPWQPPSAAARASLRAFVAQDAANDRAEQREAGRLLSQSATDSRLLLTMPPGSGKTRVALRYALAQAFDRNRRLYWITAKARGRDEVLAELQRFRDAGVTLGVLWKTVPERVCECRTLGYACPVRADTRSALFTNPLTEFRDSESWSFTELLEFARANSFCLHELSNVLERSADVVIADINYLLSPSTLAAHEAVLVIDEAQNIARRVQDHSEVRIGRDELIELQQALPHSARKTVRDILAARNGDDDANQTVRENIVFLREQLTRSSSRAPVVRAIRRASRLLTLFPEEYRVMWYRGTPDSALIGTMVDSASAVANALSAHDPVLALSGSLPRDDDSRRALFPVADTFRSVDVPSSMTPPVFIVPKLIFKYPLTAEDHQSAMDLLRELRENLPPTIAVFGQNRASNELLSMGLRVRGFTVMLDQDILEGWDAAAAASPDFLFISLGSSLSEAVNPPSDLFSAAAILSPAYRAPDEFDLLRAACEDGRWSSSELNADADAFAEHRAEAISRIIQAAGRVQRSPESLKPVFLLNEDFANTEFLRAWPRHWFSKSPHELVFPSLNAALEQWRQLARAS